MLCYNQKEMINFLLCAAKSRGLAVVVLLALALGGVAQGPGGGRGGRSMYLSLMGRKDVQRDLKMTAGQIKTFETLRDTTMKEMRGNSTDARNRPPTFMRDKMAAADRKAAAILTATQKTRIAEIHVQVMGPRAVADPEIQKKLGLTAAQKAKVDTAMKAYQAEIGKLMASLRGQSTQGGTIQAPGSVAKIETANKKLETSLNSILTTAQKTKLNSLKGRPFKADAPSRPQMGNRPGTRS